MAVTRAHDAHGHEAAWSSWLPLCCAPLTSCTADRKSRRSKSPSTSSFSASTSSLKTPWPSARMSDEELLIGQVNEKRQHPVIYDQPLHHPRPVAMLERPCQHSALEASHRRSATPQRARFWSFSSSTSARRPLISAPSNFQHISSASPMFSDFPEPTPSRASYLRPAKQLPKHETRPSYRPLQLSFYDPNKPMSPIMPDLRPLSSVPSTPVKYTPDRSHQVGDESRSLEHQKSFSSSPLSFHFPRRNLSETSPSTSLDDIPPLIPPKARARAYTSPDVTVVRERVASAMLEVERLQKQIDDVIERQSLYVPSRPSTPRSMARTMPELEPMPSIPALPPAAPSFAQRLNLEISRPHTAPVKTPPHTPTRTAFHHPRRPRTPAAASTRPRTPPPRLRRDNERPPPPPLPNVLHPPLRKKKSFSRVSSWLFPGTEGDEGPSIETTNKMRTDSKPSPSASLDEASDEAQRPRTDSSDTVTTWESDDENPTVPTSCSMGSTPAVSQDEALIARFATSGRNSSPPRRTSVGVAI